MTAFKQLDASTCAKLKPLIFQLASLNDAEALAAARAIRLTLNSNDFELRDLARHVGLWAFQIEPQNEFHELVMALGSDTDEAVLNARVCLFADLVPMGMDIPDIANAIGSPQPDAGRGCMTTVKTTYRYFVFDGRAAKDLSDLPTDPNELVLMLYRRGRLVRDIHRLEMGFVDRPAFLTDVIIDNRHFVVIEEHGGDTMIQEIVIEGEP